MGRESIRGGMRGGMRVGRDSVLDPFPTHPMSIPKCERCIGHELGMGKETDSVLDPFPIRLLPIPFTSSPCPRHTVPSDFQTLSKVVEGISNYMKWNEVGREGASFFKQTRYLYGEGMYG